MLASLPMYDLAGIRQATDAFWQAIAGGLRQEGLTGVPDRLCRDLPVDHVWQAPDLLLSQTCGYPLMTRLAGKVRVVAIPAYAADGCERHCYRSWVVVRDGDPAQAFEDIREYRLALNGWDSQSGCNTLKPLASPLAERGRFFGQIVVTGSHAASLDAVRQRAADVAAIDCVSWALQHRYRPHAVAGLRRLCGTGAVPSLPFITRGDLPEAEFGLLQQALLAAIGDPALADARNDLMLVDAVPGGSKDYEPILATRHDARSQGYRELDPR